MLGNVWEWTSDSFPTKNPKEKQLTLRGGSYLDSLDGSYNHKATVFTRMGNTADSGGGNTGFRCAYGKGGGAQAFKNYVDKLQGRKSGPRGLDQELLQKIVAEKGADGLKEYLAEKGMNAGVFTPDQLKKRHEQIKKMKREL